MPIMNKASLIDAISKDTDIPQATVAQMFDSFQETVMNTVASGTEVKLTGFLSIEPTIRSERKLKNLQTGEDLTVPEAKAVRVRPMKNFRDRVSKTD